MNHQGYREKQKEFYLAKAKEAEEKAAKSSDYLARETWEQVARNYRIMAQSYA